MVSFRIDTNLLNRLNKLGKSKTDVIEKALEMYLQSSENVNTSYKESVNTKKDNVNRLCTFIRTLHRYTINHANRRYTK